METTQNTFIGMNSNQLKIIALLAMTCDHVGKQLFPQIQILQILGRLALPIFAYMIAEGCIHTKSKRKYLLTMVGLAAVCQVVYYVAMNSLYQCILVTFSLSIVLIYLLDMAKQKKGFWRYTACVIGFAAAVFICVVLPWLIPNSDFAIDYGLLGVMLPVFVYWGKSKTTKLLLMGVLLFFLSIKMGGVQWYSLFTLVLLAFYNGKRGTLKMKHLFYIYYPLHLLGIYIIGLVVF